jgi:PAS domain S-box-containing protein
MTNNSGLSLLLVEDEAIIAASEAHFLESKGFVVKVVGSGEAAVERFRDATHDFDLVLMDIDLGRGIDGAECARQLLELRSIPVIFLTSHSESDLIERTQDISSYGILAKNSYQSLITTSIKSAYELHRAHVALMVKEHQLAESQERLAFALEATNDGIWDVNMVTNEVYLSPRDCEILGYGYEEAKDIYKIWSELVNPEDMPRTLAALEATTKGETSLFQVEQRLRTKSGAWKWIHTHGKIVARDRDGHPLRMTGTHTDISALRKAEDGFRDTEELFRLFLELCPSYVFFKDDQIRALRLSRSYERLLNRPLEECLGKTMFDLFPCELSMAMVENDKQILREGRPIEVEEELDGRWFRTTKFPIFREGKPPLLAGFTIEDTERKVTAEQLESSLRERKTLFDELNHRVKNNLLMIASLMNLSVNSLPEGKAREALLEMQTRIESMQSVYELLSRSPSLLTIDLKQHFEELAAGIGTALCAEGVCAVETNLASVRVPVDMAMTLGLVLNELLINAIKYSLQPSSCGDGTHKVYVKLEVDEVRVLLRVSDMGPGFPEKLETQESQTLGLKLIHTLVAQLKGSVSFSSLPGAEVVVSVPRSETRP